MGPLSESLLQPLRVFAELFGVYQRLRETAHAGGVLACGRRALFLVGRWEAAEQYEEERLRFFVRGHCPN